jgi:hypothetical protein
LVEPPTWYDRVRFILRKTGFGHAVLAQIKATESSDCGALPPLRSTNRPNGARCETAAQCGSGMCGALPQRAGIGLATSPRVCGECSSAQPCAADALCGAAISAYGPYQTCVVPGEGQSGALCLTDAECASARCSVPYPWARGSCAECASDADCPNNQVCGLGIAQDGGTRSCQPRNLRALGEFCAVDGECQSGVCFGGVCSECNDSQPCASPARCEHIPPDRLYVITTSLCIAGSGVRAAGEPCNTDTDCSSTHCELADPTCYLCEGASCEEMNTLDCDITRRHAGTCR